MGKGDKKTRKGKIIAGSYGKKRPKSRPRVTVKKTAEKAS
ncbi:30S ribosomal protein THX [Sphingobacterium griseoflavum]|nr:30S ribosomal protein THX [Sphingobacterium griseoflavum]